jgi:hypothetical protein
MRVRRTRQSGLRSSARSAPYLPTLGLGALGFLAFLAVVLLASGPHWREGEFALFAIPAVLLLGSLAAAFAAWIAVKRSRAGPGRAPRPR